MEEYSYISRKEWFLKNYWGKEENNLFIPNGVPNVVGFRSKVAFLLKLITNPGTIIDLGCGNGLLLRYLLEKCNHNLIPYGIDWLEKSISQAKKEVLPEFADNFTVGNVKEIAFDKFDYVLADPESVSDKDFSAYLEKCIASTNHILIFLIPQDVFNRLKTRKLTLPALKDFSWEYHLDLVIAWRYI